MRRFVLSSLSLYIIKGILYSVLIWWVVSRPVACVMPYLARPEVIQPARPEVIQPSGSTHCSGIPYVPVWCQCSRSKIRLCFCRLDQSSTVWLPGLYLIDKISTFEHIYIYKHSLSMSKIPKYSSLFSNIWYPIPYMN